MQRAALLAALILLCAWAPLVHSREPPVTKGDRNALEQSGRNVVEKYVARTRNWKKEVYSIEFQGAEGKRMEYWVIHSGDTSSPLIGGGGKSFGVYVDSDTLKVLQELRFQ